MSHKISEKTLAILKDRENGMTCKQIAEKYGTSRQYVSALCGRHDVILFQPFTEKQCVYPNLRTWLNENKVTRTEFLNRGGMLAIGENYVRFRRVISGEHNPRKDYIDMMLRVTGMTYEELFYTGGDT